MKNFYLILYSLGKFRPRTFLILIFILLIIGLSETYIITGIDIIAEILIKREIRPEVNSELILFLLAALFISPLKILFFYSSGKNTINFTANLVGKLTSFQIKSWRPKLFDAAGLLTTTLINETDLLANDILPSIWGLILSIFSLSSIIIIYSLKIGFIKVMLMAFSLIFCIVLAAFFVYPFTKRKGNQAAKYKNNIANITISIAKSIRSLNIIDSSILSITKIVSRNEIFYRSPILDQFVLQSGIKAFIDYGPYILIAIIGLIFIFFKEISSISLVSFVLEPGAFIAVIVALQRLISYGTLSYNSLYVLFSVLPRIPNIIKFLNPNNLYKYKTNNEELSFLKINKRLQNKFSLRLNKVKVKFDNSDNVAVNIGTFDLKNSNFVGVSAPSGSGKSTLFDILLGLIEPSNGEYFIESKYPLKKKDFAFLEQKPIFFFNNIISNIFMREIKDIKDLSSKKYNFLLEIIESLGFIKFIEEIGLFTNLGLSCESLSGGEKQLIALIRILLNNPKIIILDEPTASLDKLYRRKIINKLQELSKKDNLVIMSSHNAEDIKKCNLLLLKESSSDQFNLKLNN